MPVSGQLGLYEGFSMRVLLSGPVELRAARNERRRRTYKKASPASSTAPPAAPAIAAIGKPALDDDGLAGDRGAGWTTAVELASVWYCTLGAPLTGTATTARLSTKARKAGRAGLGSATATTAMLEVKFTAVMMKLDPTLGVQAARTAVMKVDKTTVVPGVVVITKVQLSQAIVVVVVVGLEVVLVVVVVVAVVVVGVVVVVVVVVEVAVAVVVVVVVVVVVLVVVLVAVVVVVVVVTAVVATA